MDKLGIGDKTVLVGVIVFHECLEFYFLRENSTVKGRVEIDFGNS